jgi:hypothetical protein
MALQSWSEAASALLERTETPVAAVAEVLGHHRGVTRRHLNGDAKPSKEMTYRTNAAIAALLGSDWVRVYLDAVALESGFIVDETREDDAFGGFISCINRISQYLNDDQGRIFSFATDTLSSIKRKKLFASATRLLFRWLTLEIDGVVPKATFFEEFKEICVRNGVPIDRWYRGQRAIRYAKASDEFDLEVRRALLSATGDDDAPILSITQRNTAAARIGQARMILEMSLGLSQAEIDDLSR